MAQNQSDTATPVEFPVIADDEARFRNIKPEFDLSEVLEAAFDLSQIDTEVSAVMRRSNLKDLQNVKLDKMPVDELNQKYPEMERPFTEDTNFLVAEELAERQRERQRLNFVQQNGAEHFLNNSITRFGAAMIPQMIDPIGYAAGAAVGGLAGVMGRAMIGIGRAGKLAKTARVGMSLARREKIAVELAENVAGNLISEFALVAPASQEELQDVGVAANFQNAVIGGIAGTAFSRSARYVVGQLSSRFNDSAANTALHQMDSGKVADISPLIREAYNEEVSGNFKGSNIGRNYEFRRVVLGRINETEFFVGGKNFSDRIGDADPAIVDTDFGEGLYMTDNPNIANGIAARRTNLNNGAVYKVALKDVNLNDLEAPFTPELEEVVKSVLKRHLPESEVNKLINSGKSGKNTFNDINTAMAAEKLPRTIQEDINTDLQDAGVDGYLHVGGDFLGEAQLRTENPHNIVFMFKPDRAKLENGFKAQGEEVHNFGERTVREILDHQRDQTKNREYDEVEVEEFEAHSPEPMRDVETTDIINDMNDQLESIEGEIVSLRELGKEADAKGLETVRDQAIENVKKAERQRKVIDELKRCMRKG